MRLFIFIHHDKDKDQPKDGRSMSIDIGECEGSTVMSKDIGEIIPPYLMHPGARIAQYLNIGTITIKEIQNNGTLENPSILVFTQDIIFDKIDDYTKCITSLKDLGYTKGSHLGNGAYVLTICPAAMRLLREDFPSK